MQATIKLHKQQLTIDKNPNLQQKNKYHIVPCHFKTKQDEVSLQNSKNNKVSNYFQSTIQQIPNPLNPQQQTQLTASIQGHKMVGTQLKDIPNLYSCLCYRLQSDPQNCMQIIAVQKIKQLTEWRKDVQWKRNQGHIGNLLMYTDLYEVLNQRVTGDVVKQENNQSNQEVNVKNNDANSDKFEGKAECEKMQIQVNPNPVE